MPSGSLLPTFKSKTGPADRPLGAGPFPGSTAGNGCRMRGTVGGGAVPSLRSPVDNGGDVRGHRIPIPLMLQKQIPV